MIRSDIYFGSSVYIRRFNLTTAMTEALCDRFYFSLAKCRTRSFSCFAKLVGIVPRRQRNRTDRTHKFLSRATLVAYGLPFLYALTLKCVREQYASTRPLIHKYDDTTGISDSKPDNSRKWKRTRTFWLLIGVSPRVLPGTVKKSITWPHFFRVTRSRQGVATLPNFVIKKSGCVSGYQRRFCVLRIQRTTKP